jgi:4-hydroxyphenylacetate 3-monooxygenase
MTAIDITAAGAADGRLVTLLFTGEEYVESLRDGREVWIYGERVRDIIAHPAFRNGARSVARLYDAMHDPDRQAALTAPTDTGNGGFTHPFFKAPRSAEDLQASRDAIVGWQHLVYGFMGRTPDYKAAFLATLGANADFYAPYQDNARRWYARAQERVLYMNHALVHPPIDRSRPADEVADICVHVEEETDNGLIVSGARSWRPPRRSPTRRSSRTRGCP